MSFNINKASKIELMTIKGVGDKIADRILLFQKKWGEFDEMKDLMRVKGVKADIFQEMINMGIYTMSKEKEKMMKEKKDVLALFRHIASIYVHGKLHKGRLWSSQMMKEAKVLWEVVSDKPEYFDMAKEAAKEKFGIWHEMNMLVERKEDPGTYGIFTEDPWLELEGDVDLRGQAYDVAWNWVEGLRVPRSSNQKLHPKEEVVFLQMIEAVLNDEEKQKYHLLDEAVRVYNELAPKRAKRYKKVVIYRQLTNKRTGVVIRHPKTGESLLKAFMHRKDTRREKADRLWQRAYYEALAIRQDEWANNQSENLAKADWHDDKVEGNAGTGPADPSIEEIHYSKVMGFGTDEKNWTHGKWMQAQAEEAYEVWMHTMRVLASAYSKISNQDMKREGAQFFWDWNQNIWDLYKDKDGQRANLMLMGNPLGMLTKEQLVELSQACSKAVLYIYPRGKYTPNALQPWKAFKAGRGEGLDGERKAAQRDYDDNRKKEVTAFHSDMNMHDFGQTDEDSNIWSQTEVADQHAHEEMEEQAQMSLLFNDEL
jgi:hypothetical protein